MSTAPQNTDEPLVASSQRSWLTMVAVVVFSLCFGLVAGLLGVLSGLATAGILYALGTPYAIAVGHVALVALFPAGIDPISLVIIECGFVALLLAATDTEDVTRPLAFAGIALTSALGLGAIAWLLIPTQPLWIVASVQLGALALAAYGIHRIERVRLGLVSAADPNDSTKPHPSDP